MQRVAIKNPYIENFLQTLDVKTVNVLRDAYINACVTRLQSEINASMKKINETFRFDPNFKNASPLCLEVRKVVYNFDKEVLKKDISVNDSSFRWIWLLRTEEVFFLKVICNESTKENNDVLLKEFMSYMCYPGNVQYPSVFNVWAYPYNRLPKDISVLYGKTLTGELACKIATSPVIQRDEQSGKALVALRAEHKEIVSRLSADKEKLAKELAELRKERAQALEEYNKKQIENEDTMRQLKELSEAVAKIEAVQNKDNKTSQSNTSPFFTKPGHA